MVRTGIVAFGILLASMLCGSAEVAAEERRIIEHITKQPMGPDGCVAHRWSPEGATPKSAVVVLNGPRQYPHSNGRPMRVPTELLMNAEAAVYGIDPPHVHRDATAQYRYAPADLVPCLEATVRWAESQGVIRLALVGDDGGARVVLMYLMTESKKGIVELVALWSTLLVPLGEGDMPAEQRAAILARVERGDESVVSEFGLPFGVRYLRELIHDKPLGERMSDILRRPGEDMPTLWFAHGLEDGNAPVDPVMDFEKSLRTSVTHRDRVLFRYYQTGQMPNSAARQDFNALLRDWFRGVARVAPDR